MPVFLHLEYFSRSGSVLLLQNSSISLMKEACKTLQRGLVQLIFLISLTCWIQSLHKFFVSESWLEAALHSWTNQLWLVRLWQSPSLCLMLVLIHHPYCPPQTDLQWSLICSDVTSLSDSTEDCPNLSRSPSNKCIVALIGWLCLVGIEFHCCCCSQTLSFSRFPLAAATASVRKSCALATAASCSWCELVSEWLLGIHPSG